MYLHFHLYFYTFNTIGSQFSFTTEVIVDFLPADVCNMDKDVGPCDDFGAVWYFEYNSRTCRRFLYGGCDGNGNRFDSREDCESRCLNGGQEEEPEEPYIPPTQAPAPTHYPPYDPHDNTHENTDHDNNGEL